MFNSIDFSLPPKPSALPPLCPLHRKSCRRSCSWCWQPLDAFNLYKCNGVADLKHAVPHMRYNDEFGRSMPNGILTLLRRFAWKFDSSRPAFQGHSRSSKPTWIDPPPMTSY